MGLEAPPVLTDPSGFPQVGVGAGVVQKLL